MITTAISVQLTLPERWRIPKIAEQNALRNGPEHKSKIIDYLDYGHLLGRVINKDDCWLQCRPKLLVTQY